MSENGAHRSDIHESPIFQRFSAHADRAYGYVMAGTLVEQCSGVVEEISAAHPDVCRQDLIGVIFGTAAVLAGGHTTLNPRNGVHVGRCIEIARQNVAQDIRAGKFPASIFAP